MSAEIVSTEGGRVIARIRGVLTRADLAAVQASAVDGIRRHGRIRLLILAEGFEGWHQGEDWSDVSFMENDPAIDRMAIVGDRRWEELALIFTAKGMRTLPIEYFDLSQEALARAWVDAA